MDDFQEIGILKSIASDVKLDTERNVDFVVLLKCKILISGVISNTRALNYTESHSYVLSVVAQDCGLNKSKPLLVTVEVKQACSTGWSGMVFIVISKSFYFSIRSDKYRYFDKEKISFDCQVCHHKSHTFLAPDLRLCFLTLHFLSANLKPIAKDLRP